MEFNDRRPARTTKKVRASKVVVGMSIKGHPVTKVNSRMIHTGWPAQPITQVEISAGPHSAVVRHSDWVEIDR